MTKIHAYIFLLKCKRKIEAEEECTTNKQATHSILQAQHEWKIIKWWHFDSDTRFTVYKNCFEYISNNLSFGNTHTNKHYHMKEKMF